MPLVLWENLGLSFLICEMETEVLVTHTLQGFGEKSEDSSPGRYYVIPCTEVYGIGVLSPHFMFL